MKKLVFASILFLGFTMIGLAQSDKMTKSINEKIAKLNTEITSTDKSQALSDEQRTKLFKLHFQKNKDIKGLKKEIKDKEKFVAARKAVNKAFHAKVRKDVMTKEQCAARKEMKKKEKKEKKK